MQDVIVMRLDVYGVCILIFVGEMYIKEAMATLMLRHEGWFCCEMVRSD